MKKKLLVSLIVAALIVVAVFSYKYFKDSNNQDLQNTKILNQGTQMHFDKLDIGLMSINNKSAWISFFDKNTESSTQKLVNIDDNIEIYGYVLQIKSVSESENFSLIPGSSQGYVKFTIIKK